MIGMLRSELFKISRRQMTWILGLLTVVLVGFLYFALAIAVFGSDAASMDEQQVADLERMVAVSSVPAFADDLIWQIVGVMAVIMIASVVGSEYAWRTIITVTAWTGDRIRPLAARYVVVAAMTAIGVAAGFVVAVACSVVFEIARGTFDSSDITAGWLGNTGLAVLTTWYTLLVYVALTALVAVLSRSSGLAIGIGLAVLFLESLLVLALDLIGDTVEFAKNFTLSWNVQAVLTANGYVPGIGEPPAADVPSAGQGAVVLAGFIGVLCVAAMYTAQRRDIVE